MFARQSFARPLVFAVAILIATLFAPIAQAEAGSEYYFEQSSNECGNFTPINPDLRLRNRGDRYRVILEFEITQDQIDAEKCAGSHFNVQLRFSGFDSWSDWESCSVDYGNHRFTFGSGIVDNGDGSAVATVYGAKFVDHRLNPGDVYRITVDCTDLVPAWGEEPSVAVDYVGTWWSIQPGVGCEPTRFVTTETNLNPGGLPVCVYTGPSATLQDGDWNEEAFLFFP